MEFYGTRTIYNNQTEKGDTHTILPLLPLTTFLQCPTSQAFWNSLGAPHIERIPFTSFLQKTNPAKAMLIFFSISERSQFRTGATWYQVGTREQIWLRGVTWAQQRAKPPALGVRAPSDWLGSLTAVTGSSRHHRDYNYDRAFLMHCTFHHPPEASGSN